MSVLLQALAREVPFSEASLAERAGVWPGMGTRGLSPAFILTLCFFLPVLGILSGSGFNVFWRNTHPPKFVSRVAISVMPLYEVVKEAIRLEPPSLFLPAPPIKEAAPSALPKGNLAATAIIPRPTPPSSSVPSAVRPESAPPVVPPAAPSSGPNLNWQAQVSFTGGSAQNAIQSMPTIIERNTESLLQLLPDGGMQLAILLYRDTNVAGSGAANSRGLQLSLTSRDNLRAALSILTESERAKPNQPVVLAQLGLVLAAQGENDKALEYLQRAQTHSPDNPAFRLFNAIQLERLGKRDIAIKEYQEAERQVIETDGWRYQLPMSLSEIHQQIVRLKGKTF